MARQILDLEPVNTADDTFWVPIDNGIESKRINMTLLSNIVATGIVPMYNSLAVGVFRINATSGKLVFEQWDGTNWLTVIDYGSVV